MNPLKDLSIDWFGALLIEYSLRHVQGCAILISQLFLNLN